MKKSIHTIGQKLKKKINRDFYEQFFNSLNGAALLLM